MLSPKNSQQGMHKRPRPNIFHTDEKPFDAGTAKTPQLLGDLDGNQEAVNPSSGRTKDTGLLRSQSLPQGKYLLKINDLRTAEDDSVTDIDEQKQETVSPNPTAGFDGLSDCNALIINNAVRRNVSKVEEDRVREPPLVSPETALNVMLDDDAEPSSDSVSIINSLKSVVNVVHSSPIVEIGPLPPSDGSASQGFQNASVSQVLPSGKVLFCGRRREMEDTVSIVTPFVRLKCGVVGGCNCENEIASRMPSDLHFFAVYDGHGGAQASHYCMERFHHLLAEEFDKTFSVRNSSIESIEQWNSKWNEVMKATYLKADKGVGGICPNGIRDDDDTLDSGCSCCADAVAPENVGTTAVVAVVGSCQIVVANCGDSRAILVRENTTIPLSKDHKPDVEEETNRIEAAGGRVICWDGYRVGGLLALSRAIGDRYLKRYVISEPDVRCIERMENDECLILASDGLWDVITNDFASVVVRKSLTTLRKKYRSRPSLPGEDPAAAAVAALLVKLAYSKGSKDNISVVVVDLKPRSCG